MKKNSTDFANLVTIFLTDYLPLQRCYSKNTILSYRDTFKLFFRFLNKYKGIQLNSFYIKDFTKPLIIEFLQWYRDIGASISAANQRLAAIKTFANFAQLESVEYIAPLQELCGIKSKKNPHKEVSFLNIDQMSRLINYPDINSYTGFRHRVILTLLYDCGCRVQELCDMTVGDVYLGIPSTVRLHGKGNKTRTVVISDETGQLIKTYLDRYRSNAMNTHPLITNRVHNKMDRDGVYYIVKKYAKLIHEEDPSFPQYVHCHMFRHSKAMHMLEANISIDYIRDYLGHENISTTNIYTRADNRLKNEAINKLAPKITGQLDLPDWNKDKELLEFLNSLK